jgi:CarD family transcriptional regulator
VGASQQQEALLKATDTALIEEVGMDFAVGDGVMYPSRGAGKITAVEQLELVDGYQDYYVIDIPSGRLTVRVPTSKAGDLGLRPVMSQASLNHVLEILGSKPNRLADDYKVRQQKVEEDLKTGRPVLLAQVIRDLTARLRRAYLTKRDGDLLTQARDLLADEMAMASDGDVTSVQDAMDAALAVQAAD